MFNYAFYNDLVGPLETLLRLLFARKAVLFELLKLFFPAWLAFVNVISKGYCSIEAFHSFVSVIFHFRPIEFDELHGLATSNAVTVCKSCVQKKFEKYVW